MPARNEIYRQITQRQTSANDEVRRSFIADLAQYTKHDTIVYSSAYLSYKPRVPDIMISVTNQDIQGFMAALEGMKGDALDLVLHSPGGSLEAAEQIVKYLRNKYNKIRAIVPQNAMSAATMIACACDEIIMGKHSAIGPIDPQITFNTPSGPFTAPAQSILDEFELAKKEIMSNPSAAALWVKRIDKYPQGFLRICENTIDLAKDKVREWLENWMLAQNAKRKELATEISTWLGSANEHKTHGHPIDINEARNHGLVVKALEDDQILQEKVLSVFHASMATHDLTTNLKFIENQNGKGYFINAEIAPRNQ